MKETLKLTAQIIRMLTPALLASMVGMVVYMFLEEAMNESNY